MLRVIDDFFNQCVSYNIFFSCRLFIENLPAETTVEEVQKEFPTATEVIHMPNRRYELSWFISDLRVQGIEVQYRFCVMKLSTIWLHENYFVSAKWVHNFVYIFQISLLVLSSVMTFDCIFSLVHMIYNSKEEAEKVFRESEDIEIHGAKMTVLYVNNKPKRNWRKEKLKKIKVFSLCSCEIKNTIELYQLSCVM